MAAKCYLTLHINAQTMQVERVETYSSSPEGLTRRFPPHREILAVVLTADGVDYHEAHEEMRRMYPVCEPALAARFPLPPDMTGGIVKAQGPRRVR